MRVRRRRRRQRAVSSGSPRSLIAIHSSERKAELGKREKGKKTRRKGSEYNVYFMHRVLYSMYRREGTPTVPFEIGRAQPIL